MTRLLMLLALSYASAAGISNPFAGVAKLHLPKPSMKPIKSVVGKVTDEISKDIADIKQPIEEGLVYIGSSQCMHVKKLVGVAYESYEGDKEPSLEDLALVFRNSHVKVSFNISSAAQQIPKASGFNPRQKLYIFVHGFTDGPSKAGFSNISNALFGEGNINVLALDASTLIKWLYLRSSTFVRFIGEKLGEVLAEMVSEGMDPAQIHIIGHSLGAHISGFTGKQFHSRTGLRVGRISGLDPAGPCFSHVDLDLKLKKSDADFVDVIHSDAGVFGLDHNVGHVDYWPNGGSQQADCFYQSCSHSRAWLYYTESVVNPQAFPAVKCDSWSDFKKGNCSDDISESYDRLSFVSPRHKGVRNRKTAEFFRLLYTTMRSADEKECMTDGKRKRQQYYMGYPSTPSASGGYYLRTGTESPFGLGVNGTEYDKSEEGVVRKIAGVVG